MDIFENLDEYPINVVVFSRNGRWTCTIWIHGIVFPSDNLLISSTPKIFILIHQIFSASYLRMKTQWNILQYPYKV